MGRPQLGHSSSAGGIAADSLTDIRQIPGGFEARIAPLNGLGNGKSYPVRAKRWPSGGPWSGFRGLAVVVARRGRTLTGEALQNAPAETSLRHSRNGQSIVYHATPGGHARHSPRARKLRPKRDDLKQLLGPAEMIE
jgi:hypothetical protein